MVTRASISKQPTIPINAVMTHSANTGGGSGFSAPDSTSTSLLRRVKAQDAEAWEQLLGVYSPLVYFWCRRSGMGAEDAADVLQEVFRAVSAAVADFRHDRPGDTFRGWLRIISRNKIRDHYRRQADQPEAAGGTHAQERFKEVAAEEPESSVASSPLGGVFCRALELIRAEFEDRTWQAFWLTTIEERPPVEVAEQLQMTPGAVRQAKYKVLRRLREQLGDTEQ